MSSPPRPETGKPAAYEFFAGGGLARLGLAAAFDTVWANDIDPMKAAAYRANFGSDDLHEGDVWAVSPSDLPGRADLAWASFPCQDVSLAGARAGMTAPRSGAFFGFARLIAALRAEGRAPGVLCLENVSGLLTSGGGADFTALVETLADIGYRCGALELDASAFTPQSRPRVFVVAVRADRPAPTALIGEGDGPGHTPGIAQAIARLPQGAREAHLRWRLPAPPRRNAALADMLDPAACCWWSAPKTQALVERMSPRHRARLAELQDGGAPFVGAVYRRMRREGDRTIQRAEARFDGLAGCLRTPAGGSSRQFLLRGEGADLRARALTAREAMRLMGAPDDYVLPAAQTAGLKIAGDGVCVPLVDWLARNLLAPLARAAV
jgi:DNA (cytosine-5)-methyltransferase 1